MWKNVMTVSSLVICLIVAACEKKPALPAAPAPAASGSELVLPTGFFLAGTPKEAVEVKDAKPNAKVGDTVTIIGRIGGSREPFVDGRAIFTLVDTRLKACGEGAEEDGCKTPWDYCCEPRKELTANMATVRIVGADGQPLKYGLMNVQGLKPLARVTVVGTVAEAEGGVLVVNASGVHVVQ